MSAFIHNLAINLALMRQLFLVIHMFYGDNLKILRTRKMFDLIDVCGFV